MKPIDITLDNVARGSAPELFERALKRVVENIVDPNTDSKAVRKVTLTVEFRPSDDRNEVRARVKAAVALAPQKAVEGMMYVGEDSGELVAVGFDPRQGDVFRTEDENRVRPIHATRGA